MLTEVYMGLLVLGEGTCGVENCGVVICGVGTLLEFWFQNLVSLKMNQTLAPHTKQQRNPNI